MKRYKRIVVTVLAVVMLLGPEWPIFVRSLYAQPTSVNPPRTSVGFKPLVEALLAATSDTTDTDQDGLPDSVEAVIGTDPNNADSDFDRLNDLWEINNDLDPMEPDSNYDGLPDYLEVTDVPSMDIDGDGIANAWDYDNDGDGVNDTADLSPSAKSEPNDLFHFDIATNSNPVFITIQLKPSHPEYLRLYGRTWDWPDGDHEGSVQDWDNSKDDVSVFPILQLFVNVAPDPAEVILNGIVVEGNTVSVPLMPVTEHGNIVAFAGRMMYPSAAPQNLTMDATLIWKVIGKVDPNSTTLGEETLLATYSDGFAITGMTIEQSEGTDAGLFYSPDINQTVAANLLLAYQFLRNSANHVADMPAVLDANDVTVDHQLATFAHRDAALVSIANQMIPDALDSLPADANLPVIVILEDKSASLDLSEFTSPGGNSFSANLTAEPVMTTKTLKTSWYNTSDKESMKTGQVMAEIKKLELSEETTYSLMTLMLYWNTGEQSLEGAGIPQTDPGDDFNLVPDVAKNIVGGGLSGLEGLYRAGVGLAGLRSYRSIKLLQSKGWTIAIGKKAIPDLAKMGDFGKFKQWVKQCDRVQDSASFFKKMDKVLEGLDTAALFVDAGFAAYGIIAISQMNNLSGIALNNAVMQVTMEYFYACMLFMIGAIPYVGWLIAIAAELSDIFGSWSDDFISWIISGISDVDFVVTPDVEIVGDPTLTITDNDNNGMDTGDRIEYRSRLKGKIQGTESYWRLVNNSEIYPYYKIYAPGGSSSVTGCPYQRQVGTDFGTMWLPITSTQWTWDIPAGWRAQEYESGVWVEPGTGMPNFPVYVELNSVYQLWYAWSWYSFCIFDWGWHHEVSWQSGQSALGGFTIYFDVLPGTIDDFARWRGIKSLDHDGDGLWDSEETQSNPWLYDSDGDGLNDKFEIDNGLNPTRHDTDGDGLIDWFEVQFGTDPTNPDTDGDGITDYLEIAGWLIQFEYAGQTFTARVYSDPAIPDTDSDGIDDYMEYRSGLNPRSQDTNGDGITDVANPKDETTALHFVSDAEIPYGICDIDVDANGFVYALTQGHIFKFDSNLNPIPAWTADAGGDGLLSSAVSMAIDDKNGLIHVGYIHGWRPSETGIITFDLVSGTRITPQPWATKQINEWYQVMELDVDADGNVYVLRRGDECVEQFDPVYNWSWCFQPPERAYIDVYNNANHEPINTWGQYATLQDENYIGANNYKTWHFYYVSEPSVFNDVEDIAIRDDGYALISEIGTSEFFYEWHTMMTGWLRMSQNKTRNDRISEYDIAGQYYRDLYSFEDPGSGQTLTLNAPAGIAVDKNGYVYIVADATYIYKFDANLVPVAVWTIDSWTHSHPLDEFGGTWEAWPRQRELVIDPNENIYTYFVLSGEVAKLSTIEKYSQSVNSVIAIQDPSPDRDGDGLLNDIETAGWEITFTDPNGTQTITVVSNPMLTDTDLDGLSDYQEQEIGTNPLDPDTDDDGVGDYAEVQAQTDPKNYDTDNDGLPDGTEVTFGSNPNSEDTDGEGLSDKQEFELGSDPNRADTDCDGLNDADEKALNTNLFSPDTDGDFMFDGQEVNLGTDPNNGDTDNDGLSDGAESVVYNTDPTNSDTDGDGLSDSTELDLHLNPLSEDTDNDGIPDGKEIEDGTNPWNGDSDHDGIPDGQDNNANLPPDVSNAHPSQEYLWPADNKYVPITIEGVTDPNNDPIQIAIVTVTSDEPSSSGCCNKINSKDRCDKNSMSCCDKNKAKPDAYFSDEGVLLLKAERDGKGNGRVYEINFMAGDDKGGLTPGKVQVKVPHSKKGNTYKCIDDGQKYEILSTIPNDPPDVSNAYPSKESLWPANRKFQKVTIQGVTDPDGDDVKIIITDITSDEPVAFSRWDIFRPDAYIIGKDIALLRAERDGKGNGRVYEITFIAEDSEGNESEGTVQVSVPHSQGQPCIDDGQNYDPLAGSARHKLKCFLQDFNKHGNNNNNRR